MARSLSRISRRGGLRIWPPSEGERLGGGTGEEARNESVKYRGCVDVFVIVVAAAAIVITMVE